jgi:RNA-binding protein 5/10
MKRKNATIASAQPGEQGSTEQPGTDTGPKYRDRAAERRITHHQPDRPAPEHLESSSNLMGNPNKRKFDGPQPPIPTPPPVSGPPPGKDESNVGNKLLAKMGWQSGTGLGMEGEGRVDPVLVKQFEMRAGLGRGKGHEAGLWQGQGGMRDKGRDLVSTWIPGDLVVV